MRNQHLTPKKLKNAVDVLTKKDRDLKIIVAQFGYPDYWTRKESFSTLIHIILEQQVSTASAKATYAKLAKVINPLTPEHIAETSDNIFRSIGLSRQKIEYCRCLAYAIIENKLNLSMLKQLSDNEVYEMLIQIKGIGAWSANIYLLVAQKRCDIWPHSDLALISAIQEIKGFSERPNTLQIEEISNQWKPWRSVAARILWHYYILTRNIRPP